jgi:hypothetical protein
MKNDDFVSVRTITMANVTSLRTGFRVKVKINGEYYKHAFGVSWVQNETVSDVKKALRCYLDYDFAPGDKIELMLHSMDKSKGYTYLSVKGRKFAEFTI